MDDNAAPLSRRTLAADIPDDEAESRRESPMDEQSSEHTAEHAGDTSRRGRTRERLIDAAYEVFADRGVHMASVEQITEHAGFTRGAFYSNFTSKEELFFALMERENSARLALLRHQMNQTLPGLGEAAFDPSVDDLGALILTFLGAEVDDRRWCLVQSEFRMLALRNGEVAADYIAFRDRFNAELTGIIVGAVSYVGLRFTLGDDEACEMLRLIYESALEDALLDGEHEQSILERGRRNLAAMLLAITEPIDEPGDEPIDESTTEPGDEPITEPAAAPLD